MSNDSPSSAEIMEALGATGFLMEQRVATRLESLGFHVWTGYPFEDPEEAKSREIDVRAYLQARRDEERRINVSVELLCECKSNENPFVFLRRRKGAYENDRFNPEQYLLPFDNYEVQSGNITRVLPAFQRFEFQKHHYYCREESKAVQFCKIVRKGKGWEANQGGIYDAMFYPLAKAVVATKKGDERLRKPRSPSEWKNINLIFPIVILHGRIYQVDATNGPLELEEVEHVSFVRELTSEAVSGQFLLDFTTEGGLEGFIKSKVKPFVEQVSDEAVRLGDEIGKKR